MSEMMQTAPVELLPNGLIRVGDELLAVSTVEGRTQIIALLLEAALSKQDAAALATRILGAIGYASKICPGHNESDYDPTYYQCDKRLPDGSYCNGLRSTARYTVGDVVEFRLTDHMDGYIDFSDRLVRALGYVTPILKNALHYIAATYPAIGPNGEPLQMIKCQEAIDHWAANVTHITCRTAGEDHVWQHEGHSDPEHPELKRVHEESDVPRVPLYVVEVRDAELDEVVDADVTPRHRGAAESVYAGLAAQYPEPRYRVRLVLSSAIGPPTGEPSNLQQRADWIRDAARKGMDRDTRLALYRKRFEWQSRTSPEEALKRADESRAFMRLTQRRRGIPIQGSLRDLVPSWFYEPDAVKWAEAIDAVKLTPHEKKVLRGIREKSIRNRRKAQFREDYVPPEVKELHAGQTPYERITFEAKHEDEPVRVRVKRKAAR